MCFNGFFQTVNLQRFAAIYRIEMFLMPPLKNYFLLLIIFSVYIITVITDKILGIFLTKIRDIY